MSEASTHPTFTQLLVQVIREPEPRVHLPTTWVALRALVEKTMRRDFTSDNHVDLGASLERVLASPRSGARVWSSGEEVAATSAAFLNAAAAYGHPVLSLAGMAPAVVASARAVADLEDVPREAVDEAVACGLEVILRTQELLLDGPGVEAWAIRGLVDRLGAAAGASRILCLDDSQITASLGLAATEAAGLATVSRRDIGPYIIGKAAHDGLEAALLAKFGFTGPPEPILGRRGLVAIVSGSGPTSSGPEPVEWRLASALGSGAHPGLR